MRGKAGATSGFLSDVSTGKLLLARGHVSAAGEQDLEGRFRLGCPTTSISFSVKNDKPETNVFSPVGLSDELLLSSDGYRLALF
jgi:hypothetical protein